MNRPDTVWQDPALVQKFLKGIRGGIPFEAAQLEVLLRVIEAAALPIRRFLDLGCGGGALTETLLARYPAAQAVLLDFSEPMLDAAKNRFRDIDPPAVFHVADLADTAWIGAAVDRAPYDAIVSGYAIHHLPDARKRQLYGEIFTLLRPGGMFINVEHVASETPWIETIFDELMIDNLHAFHGGADKSRAQIAAEYVHRPDKAANILAPVERQCEWLRQCGFEDVDCYFKAFELAVFGGRRANQ